MQRVCFLLKVKPDRLEEYREAHNPVWPEMLQAIREAGIRNYSMFFREDGLLVGYLEAENVEESLKKVSGTDVNRRWQEQMAPYFEGGSGDLKKGGVEWLKQYFHMS